MEGITAAGWEEEGQAGEAIGTERNGVEVPISEWGELTVVPLKGDVEPIKFVAAVWKVSTLADGGIRLVLDLDEGARKIMGELAKCQQVGIALEIEATRTE